MLTPRGTLQARLFWAFTLVTVIAVALPALVSRNALYGERLDLAGRQALAQAAVIGAALDSGADEGQIAALLAAVKALGLRATVADPAGRVMRDSHIEKEALSGMDNHNDRPEIEAARRNGQGIFLRRGSTLDIDSMYAAVLLADGSVLRLAVPLVSIRRSLEAEMSSFSLILAAVVCLCLLLSIFITRRFRNGIDGMAEVVAAMAENRGGHRLLQIPGKEFLPLARAVNSMAENIEEYVNTTTDQRTQLEVVLDSMHEGMLVLGPSGNIRRCNRAMRALVPGIEDAVGRQMIEALPVPVLQRRVEALLAGQASGEDYGEDAGENEDAVHFELDGRFLVAHLSLPVKRNRSLGAVIVVYDATELMRLERVRRDFVANVSHELRTPLTAITGYAETLMDMEEMDPEQRGFAGVIHKHALALGRVISDLLALARIEDAREKIPLSATDPAISLNEALRSCAEQAERKKLRFVVTGGWEHPILGNASLLAQVFRNLLENACRYAPEGSEIVIACERGEREMLFSVRDQGPGIPQTELSRIFERLYQVKKQRNSGSSGIGLAIGKHIIERHGGRIWAESPYQDFATAMLFTVPLAENAAMCPQAAP